MTILAEYTGLDLARHLVVAVIVIVCLLLSLAVMMQRPKQEGLGAAFGGDTMNDIAGAKTTDILQKGTTWLGTALFVLTFVFALLVSAGKSTTNKNDSEAPKAVEEVAKEETQKEAVEGLPANPDDALATDENSEEASEETVAAEGTGESSEKTTSEEVSEPNETPEAQPTEGGNE